MSCFGAVGLQHPGGGLAVTAGAELLGERVAGRHEGGGVARVERVDAGVGAGQSQSQNSE